jgi:hypothetical protein
MNKVTQRLFIYTAEGERHEILHELSSQTRIVTPNSPSPSRGIISAEARLFLMSLWQRQDMRASMRSGC